MNKNLSPALKKKYFQLLIERDDGFKCFYCKKDFAYDDYIYDHLNNNRSDNRLENIVLACQSCNNKKTTDTDMQKQAMQKLKQNEESNFMRERKFVKENLGEVSAEIEINTKNYDIVKEYLTKEIEKNGAIEYSNALHSSVYTCKTKTGHGSQQSVRNYISTLTSSVAPFAITRDDDKKKVIAKRMVVAT